MKIAYIFMQFPVPSETFAASDIRHLRDLGHTVEVHPLWFPYPDSQRLCGERGLHDIRQYTMRFSGYLRGLWKMLKHPGLAVKGLRLLLKERARDAFKMLLLLPPSFQILYNLETSAPDIVHLFWGHYPALVGVFLKQVQPRLPVTLFLGAYDLHMNLAVSRICARESDHVFTHARYNRTVLTDQFHVPEEKISVIYRGLDFSLVPAWNESDKIPGYMVTAGRLIPEKGFQELIMAFATQPKGRLLVLGDGPEAGRLKDLVQNQGLHDRVTFVGHVAQARVLHELKKADCFIMTSHKPSERLPNVLKEAMACGAAVFSTQSPGLEELITHKETGYILPDASASALKEALEWFNSLASAAKLSLRKNALAKVRNDFDAHRCMLSYADIFERIRMQQTEKGRSE